jgi:hypothetical protein
MLVFVAGCQRSIYTEEDIKEAIEKGKAHKFDTTSVMEEYTYHLTGDSVNDMPFGRRNWINIGTPYLLLIIASADKAREYDELTQKEIDEIIGSNSLVITLVSYGDEYDFADEYRAIIKVNGEILRPLLSDTGRDIDTTSSYPDSPKYNAQSVFYFDGFDKVKNQQIQFVLIQYDSEIVFDINMSKFK